MRIRDWSSDVCSSDLCIIPPQGLFDLLCRRKSARNRVRDRAAVYRATPPCSLLTRKAALLRLEQEGDRAVVDQADHHMGTEPAGFHPRRMIFPAACQQPAENPFRDRKSTRLNSSH